MAMTRTEHIAWCKWRALQELEYTGYSSDRRASNAYASMVSDLTKHEESASQLSSPAMQLVMAEGLRLSMFGTNEQMKHWIEGFN